MTRFDVCSRNHFTMSLRVTVFHMKQKGGPNQQWLSSCLMVVYLYSLTPPESFVLEEISR